MQRSVWEQEDVKHRGDSIEILDHYGDDIQKSAFYRVRIRSAFKLLGGGGGGE